MYNWLFRELLFVELSIGGIPALACRHTVAMHRHSGSSDRHEDFRVWRQKR